MGDRDWVSVRLGPGPGELGQGQCQAFLLSLMSGEAWHYETDVGIGSGLGLEACLLKHLYSTLFLFSACDHADSVRTGLGLGVTSTLLGTAKSTGIVWGWNGHDMGMTYQWHQCGVGVAHRNKIGGTLLKRLEFALLFCQHFLFS